MGELGPQFSHTERHLAEWLSFAAFLAEQFRRSIFLFYLGIRTAWSGCGGLMSLVSNVDRAEEFLKPLLDLYWKEKAKRPAFSKAEAMAVLKHCFAEITLYLEQKYRKFLDSFIQEYSLSSTQLHLSMNGEPWTSIQVPTLLIPEDVISAFTKEMETKGVSVDRR